MKAAVSESPRTVTVKNVPDTKIEHPCDIIVKITTTNICGSDLHMYEGRTSFETGRTLGHENMGQVMEVGSAVRKVQVGEYVVLPFNIACGFCKQCERGLTNYCLTMQPVPAFAGAAYGFADMGPYQGGQAELLRVPYGDFNALRLGEDAAERQTDYVMLSDIFPTGYHATEMAHVKPGDQTIVFGAGPVGQMAAYSALLKGAGRVWVADHQPDRLRKAEEIGAIPINTAEQNPAEVVKEATLGLGPDNGCECVGYQAHDAEGHEDASLTLNGLIDSVRFTGDIGVVGVFLPEDPGGAEAQGELEAQGKVPIDFGMMWFKGQHMGTGQAPVKRYNRALRDLIAGEKAKPSFVVSFPFTSPHVGSTHEERHPLHLPPAARSARTRPRLGQCAPGRAPGLAPAGFARALSVGDTSRHRLGHDARSASGCCPSLSRTAAHTSP
ncbi:glutathione-independent formaldehyde dehydrogenase [Streptomyces sp. NBC_01446]|uniref:glutathione-independent formaldehyde dehydrogenase n=1 Tax=Streptomyces sp. NBC_01446 TaxID=2903870 RepID=UPI002251E36A|nr:glutathione-independent formaldehyde dehydrogenase [Streptomyces sp. NBC_01446]MCX4641574.1 glutathione-independent formaldehyde dehydrogenase [Streptomyces sp. NBC_01446]